MEDEYEQLDKLHYKVENELLRLFASLQEKQTLMPLRALSVCVVKATGWQIMKIGFLTKARLPPCLS
ncbi:MAG: hypothetical protein ACE5KZ_04210 [Candidatus Scalinduaceae bacterium]